MNYQDIMKVNSEMTMLDLKGKNYAMVPERVTAFRKLYPEGFIITQTVSNDGTTVMMQASVGYYKENGEAVTLATGFAQEVKGRGMVNGTSHIENCETSAVGRALGMLGLGINGGGICSAEELANAIVAQNQMKQEGKPAGPAFIRSELKPGENADSKCETVSKIPEITPEMKYLGEAMKQLREERGITAAENKKLFVDQMKALVAAGLAPDKDIQKYTIPELEALIDAMMKNFRTTGTELIKK
jgi:hypothetical protein